MDTEAQASTKPRPHYVKTNIGWSGSGTDGDPWVAASWDVEKCTCDRPWQHLRLA